MSRWRSIARRRTMPPPTVRCARARCRSRAFDRLLSEENHMRTITLVVVALALTSVLAAQQPAFTRTVLQQGDVSIAGREAITAVAEFEPRATPGRHTHPGEEIG